MVNTECLLESTKNDILDALTNGGACIKLKNAELQKESSDGKTTTRDIKGPIRVLNRAICSLEFLRKDIESIPICQK